MSRPDDYFIAGMLVLNLDGFRKAYSSDELLRLAALREWQQHDQDVLNLICDGEKAKILHASWDVIMPNPSEMPQRLPPACRAELEESLKNPRIIHFGGRLKPWRRTDSPWTDRFWDTAVKTPYYKEMIYRIMENPDLQYDLDCVHHSVSFRVGRAVTWFPRKIRDGARCLKEHGMKYALFRTLYHLGLKKRGAE